MGIEGAGGGSRKGRGRREAGRAAGGPRVAGRLSSSGRGKAGQDAIGREPYGRAGERLATEEVPMRLRWWLLVSQPQVDMNLTRPPSESILTAEISDRIELVVDGGEWPVR